MLKQTRQGGFTLLEIIITMTLLAVIAAMGAPKLSAALRSRTTQTAVDQFVVAHALARTTAVRYGRVAQLHIDPATKRFWVEVDTSATGANQRATVWYTRQMTDAGLTMTSNRSLLCFDARGLPNTTAPCESPDAQVIFRALDKADTLNIASLGKVLR
jgi:prepilin-type N-terminal cleavage/methylation domain-containing protein